MDNETLGRAILAHCADGPDALLVATLKGTPDAMTLAEAIIDIHHSGLEHRVASQGAGRELDDMFMLGTARWGRRVDHRGLNRFHEALARWSARLDSLPSLAMESLQTLFTGDGSMWIIAPDHACWPRQLADLSERSDWAPPLCLWPLSDPEAPMTTAATWRAP